MKGKYMKNKEKLSLGFKTGAGLFAFIAIFMGFLDSIKFTSEFGSESGAKLFNFMLSEEAHHNAGAIIGLALLILAIAGLGWLLIAKLTKNSSEKRDMIIAICTIVCLVISAILIFLTKTFILKDVLPEVKEFVSYNLGVGPICWGVFSLISAGLLTTSVVIDRK